MRGLMRMLMMFGPLIFRQYQKYQRNKAQQQQSAQNTDKQVNREQQSEWQQGNDRGNHT